MNQLIDFFARKGVFSDLLTVAVFALGIGSIFLLQREVFPNVSFDIVTVQTIYPGASPQEVEKLITNPIEQELKEVDGVKKLTSTSTEGRSIIVAQLDPDQTTEDQAKADIQDVVDQIQNFPDDAEEPLVRTVESKQQPIIEVVLAGNLSKMELREEAKKLEDRLESVKGVARVSTRGIRDLEIRVELDPKALTRYQITLEDVILALKNQNISIPGGVVETPEDSSDQKELILRTSGDFESPKDVEDTVVRSNELGTAVRVRDIAKVFYGLEKTTILNNKDGLPSLSLTVMRTEGSDAITLVDQVKEMVEKTKPNLNDGIVVSYVNDLSYYIRRRLSVLSNNFMIGMVLVLFVLSLILPFKVALIAGLGIPFAFLGTLFVFNSADISINLLTVMGLIIVLGMLVDDAIVVTDNSVRLIQEGMDPTEAAIKGTQQVWAPVFASVMTTIFAFLPMMMMSGIFGKFAGYLPIGVVVGLLISLIECYFVLPHHIARWIREGKHKDAKNPGPVKRLLGKTESYWDEKVVPGYVALLKSVLRYRYFVAGGLVVLLGFSMFWAGQKMKFILFPPQGVEIFFIRSEAPVGTSLERTGILTRPIEDVVAQLPDVELDSFTTQVGIQQQDPNDPSTKRGSHYSQVVVYLTPEPDRDRKAYQIIDELREKIGKPPGLEKVAFQRVNPGPPVGKPVSVGIRAKTYEEILPAAEALKKRIASIDGTSDVETSYVPGKDELIVKLDPVELAASGLTVGMVGNAVRSAYEGIVATSIRTLDEEIDVRVTLPRSSRSRAETLSSLSIRNPQGRLIPLSRISKLEPTQSVAVFEHEANQRQVRVTSELDTFKTSSTETNRILKEQVPELEKQFPGTSYFFGGEDEDTQESMQSLFRAFLIAVIAIFLMLVFLFNNLLQPSLILLTIPLGIISVIWTLYLHGRPITFMAALGTIALAGVIVNNAIVFVDFVNNNRKQGMSKIDSILAAAKMRVRPIFLTTVTTVCGILPTAYGWGGLDPFVVPVVLALGWGMFFGSFMTAFVLPSAIGILDDISQFFSKKGPGPQTAAATATSGNGHSRDLPA